MSNLAWTPWHKVVELRPDVKSGELSLAIFAADLYDVAMGQAKSVYQSPAEFFALTYPTYNLRQLVKDVVLRLEGRNDKATRLLDLTYGGGKTHTLITLYHLVNDPTNLPNLPTVAEFTQAIGKHPPQARIAILAFDKLDAETGMEVRGPRGESRRLKQPWSVLAFQLAGADGLKILNGGDNNESERESEPAENIMTELLAYPAKDGLGTLVLIDEVLMYARAKVGLDHNWLSKLMNFFQYFTQAATKVERCAVVASLLATDPSKNDELGKEIMHNLAEVIRREKEENVQPVGKEDVAEVLRRRFFTPASIKDQNVFRPHVQAALKGIGELDEQTRKDEKNSEERFLKSYPFHPDLTDIFYSKWTNLEGFQRTRGILRTFAQALREAESWDESPLVSTNAFLSAPGQTDLSTAARELASIAAQEEYEGKRQDWVGILQGELEKAKEIQAEAVGLKFREIEGAVFGTFLHSQPTNQTSKATSRELLLLVGHTRPDKIELEKGLRSWTEVSWFLDEATLGEVETGGKQLPKSWRLGYKPNLLQMHHAARQLVSTSLIAERLESEIRKQKSLTADAREAGAKVHLLPERPGSVEDDGEFHYAILGPRAASEADKPSQEARRFVEENTGSERPRIYQNAIVLSVPSRDGLEVARAAIRDYLAWEEVKSQLDKQEADALRNETLQAKLRSAEKAIPEVIRQAYCIVVTLSEKNEVQAFKLLPGSGPLFSQIKDDKRARIQDKAISAEALLPDGPYDIWRETDEAQRVHNLVTAFAQRAQLPKMLKSQAILETLIDGCEKGNFILRLTRPDHSVKTFWRVAPDEAALKDRSLEAVLPARATLSELSPRLLVPGALPKLWQGAELTLQELGNYFSGSHIVTFEGGSYQEPVTIPRAEREVLETVVKASVREGKLWLTSGSGSFWQEEIVPGFLTDAAVLQAPPSAIPPLQLIPEQLPQAWHSDNAVDGQVCF